MSLKIFNDKLQNEDSLEVRVDPSSIVLESGLKLPE
jgi:hypothetical protein